MATVTSIRDAISTQLLAIDDVDYASTDNFLPSIQTVKVAALTLAFDLETSSIVKSQISSAGTLIFHVHRIRTEFWVKHVQGSESATMDYAVDIGRQAINQLVANDGTGYEIHIPSTFEFQVDQAMVQETAHPWLVCSLVTPVQDIECVIP